MEVLISIECDAEQTDKVKEAVRLFVEALDTAPGIHSHYTLRGDV